ncbi:MAG: hypothetical protein J6P44_04125 [Bacteroidales bacterium]|nr:hypothetical protein [Bacteroidales bacterium]
MTGTAEITDWYMRFLNPLSDEVKIEIMKRLLDSLAESIKARNNSENKDIALPDFKGGWEYIKREK